MSQANAGDFPIDPQVTSGTALAEILNRFYNATNTQNSGATQPPVTYPGMFWYDTSVTPPVLKIRNAGNSGWVDFADSLSITAGDITGLGTMAAVNSPAPIANGGTSATTAAQARINLGIEGTYVKKTGDSMTGSLTAPGFFLDADTYFNQSGDVAYLHFNPNKYLALTLSTGVLQFYSTWGGMTLCGNGGDATFIRDLYCLNQNMGLIGSDPARRYLRFATDNWRLEWITSNGTLQYINQSGAVLWRSDSGGNTFNNGNQSATYLSVRDPGAVALNIDGYSDWGNGTLGRHVFTVNPGWAAIYCQGLHVQGQWAGLRFTGTGGSYIDFRLSGARGLITNCDIDGSAGSTGFANNTDNLGGRHYSQWIHNNATAVVYIRNEAAAHFIGMISGYGEVNWPVGPSDARLKENVVPTTMDSLDAISKLKFVEYNFKPVPSTNEGEADFMIDDGHTHALGLTAQQAQSVSPELVSTAGTYLQLNPQELALLALHGVQQLLARVTALETT